MNVVIISRSEQKLQSVRREILELYPSVEVEVLSHDFTERSKADAFYEKLSDSCARKGSELGILVNNVGIVNGVSARLVCKVLGR